MSDKPNFAFNLRLDGGRVTIETPGQEHFGPYHDIRLTTPNGEFVTIKVRQPEPHGYGHAWRFIVDGLEVVSASISQVPDIEQLSRDGALMLLKSDEDGPRDWKPVRLE